MYYSQIQQDKILNEVFFKNMRGGFFVDVGAHDGINCSNTYFYEKELGWNGICIEPYPRIFKELEKNRRCSCIEAAICNETSEKPFLEISGYSEMISGLVETYDPRHLTRISNEVRDTNGKTNIINVQTKRLKDIFEEHNVKEVHYLSIDTEGAELEVLKSIDFNKVNIHIIDIENNYDDTFSVIKTFLESNGFKHAFPISFDQIFINSKSIQA